jgi:hypothetical protein
MQQKERESGKELIGLTDVLAAAAYPSCPSMLGSADTGWSLANVVRQAAASILQSRRSG